MTLASRLTALAQAIGADIKGLRTTLGNNPQGTAADVATRFANIEAGRTPVGPSGVVVQKIANAINVPNATWISLPADQVRNGNQDANWSAAAPDRLTAKTSGWYNVWGNVLWGASTAGRRLMALNVNGTSSVRQYGRGDRTANAVDTGQSESWIVWLNAGDFVQIQVFQDSGAAMTLPYSFAYGEYAYVFGMVPVQGPKGEKGDAASIVHGVSARRTTTLAVPTATWTTVSFDSLVADNADGQYSAAAADRLTAKATGWYTVVATILWPGPNGNGRRLIGLGVNGASSVQRGDLDPNASATDQMQTESFLVYLNAGDYIQIQVYQDSGATLTLTATWPQVSLAPHQGSPGPAGANTVRQQRVNVPAFSPNAITFAVDGSKDLGWKLNIVGQIAAITVAKYPYVQFNGLTPYWNQAIEHYVYVNNGAPTQNVQAVKGGSGGAGFGFVFAELGLFNVVLDITAEILINAASAPNIDAAGNVALTALEFTAIANWMIRAPAGSGNFEGGDTYNSVEYQQQQLGGGIKSLLLNLDGASFKGDVILTPLLS